MNSYEQMKRDLNNFSRRFIIGMSILFIGNIIFTILFLLFLASFA